ncbi:hypothetical protein [Frankia sp. Cj3]|uniref:hypothetical protein n=1 Tax=Frankia sp. Cj3 TaxID=2880976 RepID=UPI001EF51C8D|nr:hypothetical protein [Frankia sp. Cj3]
MPKWPVPHRFPSNPRAQNLLDWMAGIEDVPPPGNASPFLARCARTVYHTADRDDLWELHEIVPRMLDTAHDEQESARQLMGLDWLMRIFPSFWYRRVPRLAKAADRMLSRQPIGSMADVAAIAEDRNTVITATATLRVHYVLQARPEMLLAADSCQRWAIPSVHLANTIATIAQSPDIVGGPAPWRYDLSVARDACMVAALTIMGEYAEQHPEQTSADKLAAVVRGRLASTAITVDASGRDLIARMVGEA